MIPDTNMVNQVAGDALAVKAQVQANWTAIAIAAAWLGREIRNFNLWLESVVSKVISHGGIGWLIYKLVWNPPTKP
jgi:hypothetical protein